VNHGQVGPLGDGPLFAYGFSWRKRRYVRAFAGRKDVRFVRDGRHVHADARLLLWGSAPVPMGVHAGVRVVRLEDGFLRSVGLGADLIRPLSWVVDELGIYYDAGRPSALENLLQNVEFDDSEIARARALRERIVQTGLTKYNLSSPEWRRPANGRAAVLVAGQVETDASISKGALDIRTNLALLQAVRAARPAAWIVYKPHPDVVAGLRRGGAGEAEAANYCDELLTDASMHHLLLLVDEVHVMTSLAGFEALLRGKPVFCWGHPFYAGWGLTHDSHVHPRRTRKLALDQLVAAALLRYAIYLHPTRGGRCTAEESLQGLIEWRERKPQAAWWQRLLRPFLARP
jgi:capsular polysaccharide export protein